MAMAVASATGGIRIGNTVYANRLMPGGGRALPSAVAAQPNPPSVAVATPPVPTNGMQPAQITALPSDNAVPVAALPSSPIPVDAKNFTSATTAQEMPLPQGLSDDAMIMKALGLYRNVAASAGGQTLN